MNALGRATGSVVEAAPSVAAYSLGMPAGLAYDAVTGGAGVMSQDQFAGRLRASENSNLRNALGENSRQVAEMQRSQPHAFPAQLSGQERDAMPGNLQHIANPGAQDPRFMAALQELIAAHGGAR